MTSWTEIQEEAHLERLRAQESRSIPELHKARRRATSWFVKGVVGVPLLISLVYISFVRIAEHRYLGAVIPSLISLLVLLLVVALLSCSYVELFDAWLSFHNRRSNSAMRQLVAEGYDPTGKIPHQKAFFIWAFWKAPSLELLENELLETMSLFRKSEDRLRKQREVEKKNIQMVLTFDSILKSFEERAVLELKKRAARAKSILARRCYEEGLVATSRREKRRLFKRAIHEEVLAKRRDERVVLVRKA